MLIIEILEIKLEIVAHTCIPSVSEAEKGRFLEVKASLSHTVS